MTQTWNVVSSPQTQCSASAFSEIKILCIISLHCGPAFTLIAQTSSTTPNALRNLSSLASLICSGNKYITVLPLSPSGVDWCHECWVYTHTYKVQRLQWHWSKTGLTDSETGCVWSSAGQRELCPFDVCWQSLTGQIFPPSWSLKTHNNRVFAFK